MYSANAFTIREARVDDVPELVRLGWATREDWPTGQIIDGVVAAALAIDENRAVTAAVPRAPYLLAHMRARVIGIKAYRKTPNLADRMRSAMRHAA